MSHTQDLKIRNRRTRFLINPEFQFRFLAFQIVSSLITVGVFFFANSYFFSKMKEAGQAVGLHENHVFFKFVQHQELAMNWIFIVAAFITTALLALVGIIYSHKIAGPLYNLQRYLQEYTFKRRVDKPLKFRDHDFFPEIAEDFNMFMNERNPPEGDKKEPAA
ncbi:MAG TPA: hypothetical protein VM901_01725 [Bdellovibrionota bacterium]|jgi:hypothetical protein|nr:hypothetical protein [Bdellovibrionota bacterium]